MADIQRHTIPKAFHSDASASPFTNCKVCDIDLLESQIPYTIEKAFRKQHDGTIITLFELAICIPCARKQAAKMSAESQSFLQQTLMREDVLRKRQELWEENWQTKWDSQCLFSDKQLNELEEYHVVGHFQGNEVVQGQVPFIIGQNMLEYLQEHLSKETKEEFDDFGRQHLGPDPTLAKLLEEDYQFILV